VIILDTHAWIWWASSSSKLADKAAEAIEKSSKIGIPAICCWELAMLEAKKRIGFSMELQLWIDIALQNDKVDIIPLSPEIAVLSSRLPGNFHGDPADRIIVASSIICKAPLISKDRKIQDYNFVKTVWD
jgi:PIN domain nuclease of toxin-antitoxin system